VKEGESHGGMGEAVEERGEFIKFECAREGFLQSWKRGDGMIWEEVI